MNISPREMDKLSHMWDFHRFDCHNKGDMKIELRDGGGIGARVIGVCACGKELDATD